MRIASLVTSALQPGTATGLSRVAGTDVFLRDCLAKNPAAWLGEAHAAHWGVSLGFRLKLLHSRDRLLLQTHPDGARARKYFGLPSGKDEAWYVLDTRPGACIWLGFRPGVTPAYFRELIERQDTAALLDCLHQIPIRPGEVYFIPAGTAHAMGSDSLVAELQEPVDITLRAEYIRPDGSRLPVESMYGPAGMDGLLDCFHFDCLPREELLARHRFRPAPGAEEPWRKRLITPEQTPRFYMDEVELRREAHGSALCVTTGSRCSWCWRGRRSSNGRAVLCGPAGARSSLSPTAWPLPPVYGGGDVPPAGVRASGRVKRLRTEGRSAGRRSAPLFRSFSPGEQTLFLIGLAAHRLHRVAGRVDNLAQPCLVDRLLRHHDGLFPAVGGDDLLDGEGLADGVIYMGFTHAAHHPVHHKSILCHKTAPFPLRCAGIYC